MLIIKRHTGSSIRIGEEIEIKVLGVQNEEVRIGISAPQSTKVLREEIAQHPVGRRSEHGGHQEATGRPRQGHTGLYRRGRIHQR